MHIIQKNLKKINQNIIQIAKSFKIDPTTIKLIAVSKNRSIKDIEKAILCGQHAFGENYVQESIPKIKSLNNNIEWHFIGHIQSNKAHKIAKYFSWCHTISNRKIAILLNKYRPIHLPKLNILIQIDIRTNFSNINENILKLEQLVNTIKNLKNLNLRGIMAMPYKKSTYFEQIQSYKNIRLYFLSIKKKLFSVDTLSLGTSHDISAAIFSGSTLLRLGSAIFNTK